MLKKVSKKTKIILIGLIIFICLFPFIFISLSKSKHKEQIKLTYDRATSVSSVYTNNYDDYDYDTSLFNISKSNSSDSFEGETAVANEDYYDDYDNSTEDSSTSNTTSENLLENKKLRKTYDYTVETTEYDDFISVLNDKINSLGGYVDYFYIDKRNQSNSSLTKDYTVRKGYYTIKVTADKADQLAATFDSKTEVTYQNIQTEDVTTQYIDLDTHIETLAEEYRTLETLLTQAQSVTETIEVQDRLSAIKYEIDSYTKQLDTLEKDVEFSTFTLTINEVIYYNDTVEKFSSDVAERWAYVFESWLSDIVPTILLLFISFIPFIILIIVLILYTTKKIQRIKQEYKQTIILKNEET